MKKALLFLSCLLILFTSCSKDDPDLGTSPNGNNLKSTKIRWYGTKLPEKNLTLRGVADGSKRWNADNGIYVKFLNNPKDPTILDEVKTIAKEWEEYAGIKFHFVEPSQKADIRIAFNWNDNDFLTWSYTGTDAKYERNTTKPTAVFGGIEDIDAESRRGDVLRVFGQILGLEYEQRHQDWAKNGYWKSESQLQKYWEDLFDGIDMDWDEIREYVFTPLTEENATVLMKTRAIDVASIMVWPYYNSRQTSKPLSNLELSEGDKAFIAKLYPKTKDETIADPTLILDCGYDLPSSFNLTGWNDYYRDVHLNGNWSIGKHPTKASVYLPANTSEILIIIPCAEEGTTNTIVSLSGTFPTAGPENQWVDIDITKLKNYNPLLVINGQIGIRLPKWTEIGVREGLNPQLATEDTELLPVMGGWQWWDMSYVKKNPAVKIWGY